MNIMIIDFGLLSTLLFGVGTSFVQPTWPWSRWNINIMSTVWQHISLQSCLPATLTSKTVAATITLVITSETTTTTTKKIKKIQSAHLTLWFPPVPNSHWGPNGHRCWRRSTNNHQQLTCTPACIINNNINNNNHNFTLCPLNSVGCATKLPVTN